MTTATEAPKTDILPEIDDGTSEPDGFSHYARADKIAQGGVLVALCGKKWNPKIRSHEHAEALPVHPVCEELFRTLQAMRG